MFCMMVGYTPIRCKVLYVNYKGEEAWRDVSVTGLHWGNTQWHGEAQLLLEVYDHDKKADRTFAAKDIKDARY